MLEGKKMTFIPDTTNKRRLHYHDIPKTPRHCTRIFHHSGRLCSNNWNGFGAYRDNVLVRRFDDRSPCQLLTVRLTVGFAEIGRSIEPQRTTA